MEELTGLIGILVLAGLAVFFLGPFLVLGAVAQELRRSPAFMLWGIGGWFGAVLGLLWLIAVGRKGEAA